MGYSDGSLRGGGTIAAESMVEGDGGGRPDRGTCII